MSKSDADHLFLPMTRQQPVATSLAELHQRVGCTPPWLPLARPVLTTCQMFTRSERIEMPIVSSTPGEVTVVRSADDLPPTSDYWPINWSAIWVGALSALAVALILSLAGAAVGAHQLGPAGKIAIRPLATVHP